MIAPIVASGLSRVSAMMTDHLLHGIIMQTYLESPIPWNDFAKSCSKFHLDALSDSHKEREPLTELFFREGPYARHVTDERSNSGCPKIHFFLDHPVVPERPDISVRYRAFSE
jgi:hypothetical protein